MRIILTLLVSTLVTTAVYAAPVTIDFTTMTAGTPVTNQFPGVTFSLSGLNDSSGPPVIDNYGTAGLSNSVTGNYPTAQFLIATFAAPTTGISFFFNNEGFNGLNAVNLRDASNALIATALLNGSGVAFYDFSSFANVASIEWDNGIGAGGGDWVQELNILNFDSTAAPELNPASASLPLAFLSVGLLLAGSARRRTAV